MDRSMLRAGWFARALTALGLAAALLPWAPGPAAPARADHRAGPRPGGAAGIRD